MGKQLDAILRLIILVTTNAIDGAATTFSIFDDTPSIPTAFLGSKPSNYFCTKYCCMGDTLESTKALSVSSVGGDALSSMAGKYSFTILVKKPLKPFAISTGSVISLSPSFNFEGGGGVGTDMFWIKYKKDKPNGYWNITGKDKFRGFVIGCKQLSVYTLLDAMFSYLGNSSNEGIGLILI